MKTEQDVSIARKPIVSIVNQTHWDREWYEPLETFRYRLTEVMARILDGLDKSEMTRFVLDGQVAALEDYLEVCEPEDKERVLAFIADGRLIIGPWYVLADEFLVHGEALVRNLAIGMKASGTFGQPQMIGYLPDTFGHIGQMPQLLRQFGIDNAILWRGLAGHKAELVWQSPDGSKIDTFFLPEGYYQPIVDRPTYEQDMKTYVDKVVPYATTEHVLLTNGGDHLMPQYGSLTERIAKLNERFEGKVEFVESDYSDYVAKVREAAAKSGVKWETHSGEMRDNAHIYVLPNVLSTRSYLKEQNQRVEDELLGFTEPLWAVAAAFSSAAYPQAYLTNTWKSLLHNHPHDSICGCSVDAVHQEMETRTMKLEQRLLSMQNGALSRLGLKDRAASGDGIVKPFQDMTSFTVFQPHAQPYTGIVQGRIWLQKESNLATNGFKVVDADGQVVPCTIVRSEASRYFNSPLDDFPQFQDARWFELAMEVKDLPGVSLTSYSLQEVEAEAKGKAGELVTSTGRTIRNAWGIWTLTDQGTLHVVDLQTGTTYTDWNRLYSVSDAGDSYNFSRLQDEVTSYGELVGEPSIEVSEHVQIMKYCLRIWLPESLNADRLSVSDVKVKTELNFEIRLGNNSPFAEVRLTVANRAKDQRLRLQFPTGAILKETLSDSAFDVVARPVKREEKRKAEKQKEVPVVVEPTLSLIRAEAEENGQGIVVLQRGLQEYQVVSGGDGDVVELTVLRSVGWLSRDDFASRGGGAGPQMETPDAQCIGTYTFEYAMRPGNAAISNGEVLNEALRFRRKPRIVEGSFGQKDTYQTTGIQFIEIDNPAIVMTALYRQDGQTLLRVVNVGERSETFRLRTGLKLGSLHHVQLDGTMVCKLDINQGILVGPKEIVTLAITWVKG
ncbi:glycoside hydrolase family 38 N-terminal domain-containing protein [Paenibacillus roseipurpureus]|uniref:Glycoside hydrolase family 38 C-terminal domain-containing protein n=1 Tax=Paenibacillus roseopurpureus TaxID=2918901 RepID=A0AA96LRU2_9BACL|nr:glycoside hydrolase family 38 C-terminal domain-containing protein [Paenibacillus sp. MBLB1832]WNR46133.1 glycoside hydrolase family 38 C-terminal domain-containing protein [Paenibacillus sp. MBLB1832]